MKTRGISQKKIARDLGLSQALVSMVLNGKKEGVSSSSYRRIWGYADREGYRPKGMTLATNGFKKVEMGIGYVLREGVSLANQSSFFAHVQQGMYDFLISQGHETIYLGNESTMTEEVFHHFFESRRALRGIVVMGQIQEAFLDRLREKERRIVAITARYSGKCHSIVGNDLQAAEQLVKHLIGLGHQSFVWVGGNRGSQRAEQRLEAVKQSLFSRKIPTSALMTIELPLADREAGKNAVPLILKKCGSGKIPTAWICFSGLMGRGVVDGLLQHQVAIPQQANVVVFDRTPSLMLETPTLTGAGVAPDRLGKMAAEMILKCTGEMDEVFSDLILPTELLLGQSTS